MTWSKPRPWSGKDLVGEWLVTIKIDGVQARMTESGWRSRNDKPLYNLDHIEASVGVVVEVYDGSSWDTTVGLVRSSKNGSPVPRDYVYPLAPYLDPRLLLDDRLVTNPSSASVQSYMKRAVRDGYEGLVLVNVATSERLKVKPSETHDVRVTGVQAGTGRNAGRMGALVTKRGKVGTGFTDEERELWWRRRRKIARGEPFVIEVGCMGLTRAGKFRHPRFERERFDKEGEP